MYRTDNDHVLFLLGEQKEHRSRFFSSAEQLPITAVQAILVGH